MKRVKLLIILMVIALSGLVIFKVIQDKQLSVIKLETVKSVGEEQIFQSDYEYQRRFIPNYLTGMTTQKIINQRIIKQSVALQAASKQGLINLDSEIYNSDQKDQQKRLQQVMEVEQKIASQAASLSGTAVSIWFLNNRVSPLGYERSKQLAFEKISKLHNEVKSGKITIDQAAQAIKNDPSLAQLDKSYQINAVYKFKVGKNEAAVRNPAFNEALWKLNKGEVSDIYTLNGEDFGDGGKIKEANYSFVRITDKQSDGVAGFDEWLSKYYDKYQVIYE